MDFALYTVFYVSWRLLIGYVLLTQTISSYLVFCVREVVELVDILQWIHVIIVISMSLGISSQMISSSHL